MKQSENDTLTGIAKFELDEDIIAATDGDKKPRLKIYQYPSTAIVLGRGSSLEDEVNVKKCQELDIPIMRRRGGGCSVLLDCGNVIISLTAAVSGYGNNHLHFKAISEWLCAGLGKLSVDEPRQEGISDIAVNDRKIGGSCLYRKKGFLYYSATLLVSPNIDMMQQCLKHPPREPEYRRGRKHVDFVRKISTDLSPNEFIQKLKESIDICELKLQGN